MDVIQMMLAVCDDLGIVMSPSSTMSDLEHTVQGGNS